MSSPFNVGARVIRAIDVYHLDKGYRLGTVVNRYGRHGGLDGVRWYDPEIYAVLFDDGVYEEGFFRHGLDLCPSSGVQEPTP